MLSSPNAPVTSLLRLEQAFAIQISVVFRFDATLGPCIAQDGKRIDSAVGVTMPEHSALPERPPLKLDLGVLVPRSPSQKLEICIVLTVPGCRSGKHCNASTEQLGRCIRALWERAVKRSMPKGVHNRVE